MGLGNFNVGAENDVLHQHATCRPLHRVCVNVVSVAHVGILRAPLLERLLTVEHWARERFLPRVRPDMVVQRAR